MKLHKITYLALIAAVCSLQSCNDYEEVFHNESAATRMSNYLTKAKTVLTSSEKGWVFDYYPHKERVLGGYTYTVKFKGDEVEGQIELKPGAKIKSTYAMVVGNGPELSFDTYNKWLHLFATPSSEQYEGLNGDFEFVIDSIGEDVMKVHGNRCQNVMFLRRLKEDATTYLQKVEQVSRNFLLSASKGTIGGKPIEVEYNTKQRQIAFYADGKEIASSAYSYTDKGLRLYLPIEINGVTVHELTYNAEKLTLTAPQVNLDKGFLHPNVLVKMIGEQLSVPKQGVDKTYNNIPGLDKFTFTTDDNSWIKITKEGNNLKIHIDECTTMFRVGVITISNGKDKAKIQVLQM